MRRFGLVLLVAFAGFVGEAHAVTLLKSDGTPSRYQRYARTAKMPTSKERIHVVIEPGACGDAVACTSPKRPIIWIAQPEYVDRRDILHELGHRFDYQRMTDRSRQRFQRIMLLTGREWLGTFSRDPNPPVERFAEAWRMCAMNPLRPDRDTYGYHYHPTVRQHRAVCQMIRSL